MSDTKMSVFLENACGVGTMRVSMGLRSVPAGILSNDLRAAWMKRGKI